MYIITEEYLVKLNSGIIKNDDDNRPGIRDGAGSDLYFQLEAINYEEDPITKSSLAIYTSNSHIFNNGNKRTAWALADAILGEYGFYLKANPDEIVEFSCWVASIEIPDKMSKEELVEEIIKWIKVRISRLGSDS
jgi:death-on-curing family protein